VSWDGILDVAAAVCLLAGSFLTLAAGVGLLRFPDLLARMHVGAKPQVLGVLLALTGFALRIRVAEVIWTVGLVAVFQLLTAPVAAHMVARAGYRTGKVHSDRLVIDELTADLTAAAGDARPERDRPSRE
jgi:multicomponent Na+:H+ antiporter subunit G